LRQRGVVYDVGRSMGAHSPSWRPDYSPALMRRELDIIQADLHASAVRLGGRDPRRLLDAASYAASIGLNVWLGPELWNATPRQTLRFVTDAAAAAEPLFRRWPDRLTFCVGNELTMCMRGIVSYCALQFERVDWDHFDIVGVNHYRQIQGLTTERYLAKIRQLQATGKPVAITEFGFAACRDADNPEFLSTLNSTNLSLLGSLTPVLKRFVRPRVRTVHPRDEPAQARLLTDQLQMLDHAGVDGVFVMSFSFPLAPYSEDPRHDLDATALSIVRTLPRGQRGATHPGVGWEPKEAFHAIARYYRQQEPGLRPAQG